MSQKTCPRCRQVPCSLQCPHADPFAGLSLHEHLDHEAGIAWPGEPISVDCDPRDLGEPSERVVHLDSEFKAGRRVRFCRDLERYPHFMVPAGTMGIVAEATRSGMVVRVDEDARIEGLASWGNEVRFVSGDSSLYADYLDILFLTSPAPAPAPVLGPDDILF